MKFTRGTTHHALQAGWNLAAVKGLSYRVRILKAVKSYAVVKHPDGLVTMIAYRDIIDLHREGVAA